MVQQVVAPTEVQDQRYAMTYEEYLTKVDEGTHAEWVDGEVTVFMPPKVAHQRMQNLLSTLMTDFVEAFDLGEVLTAPCEMLLVPGHIAREPDILFVAKEHLGRLTEDRLEGPADLVIEFLSDSSVRRDRDVKFYEYQEAGIPEYWIFDPRRKKERVDFFQLGQDGTYHAVALDENGRYFSRALPGFWLMPSWFWQDPLPNPLVLLARIAPQALHAALREHEGNG
jgi:Uma2 family endonuclease